MGKTSKDVTTKTVDPAVAKDSNALNNLFRSLASSGYEPDRGVTIADFTPQQKTAMQSTDVAAAAFGAPTSGFGVGQLDPQGNPRLDFSAGPVAERSASGIMGFRPSGEFDASRAALSEDKSQAMDQFYTDMGKQRKYKQFKPKSSGGGKK